MIGHHCFFLLVVLSRPVGSIPFQVHFCLQLTRVILSISRDTGIYRHDNQLTLRVLIIILLVVY
jgi:hypothetical protein